MTLAQHRLVVSWIVLVLTVPAISAAVRWPWLSVLAAPLALFFVFLRFTNHSLARTPALSFSDLFEQQAWLQPVYLAVLALIVGVSALISLRVVDWAVWRYPNQAVALILALLLPAIVAKEFTRYRLLGLQSNQPFHPTTQAAEPPSSPGERRR